MAKRLTRITTKTGDDGTTGLGDGTRVRKSDPLVVAIGEVDELNSWIGLLVAHLGEQETLQRLLVRCQHLLFDLGGELSIPGRRELDPKDLQFLERATRDLNDELPHLENFILPGGTTVASVCHLARSVCRRAERSIVATGKSRELNPVAPILLHRLSDFLFVMARTIARSEGGEEILWQPRTER